ncbi:MULTISPECIES: hypothetical protein [unclassified Shinella]|uniref:hypothetical protein n=1 Tax=unclassified Shinella TaxID=2643062 RepID=UPI00225DC2E1|nr:MULTISPECIES: hypothetical protein [unclassified Shinella]MCO5140857.1 hypothetical protein [Shinella sp.]MDC7256454.1 hypothetical protein [Shinella sp. YE25]CAI0339322.1 hypothetical protein SHINE37_43176 [Rhizobiaceae bacterium]CAK7257729.1 protein of unknown function [Shinella sp. WSC3-e]
MNVPKKIEMPQAADSSAQEILRTALIRLENIEKVLEAEYRWMKSHVEHCRQIDDAGIAYELENGLINQEEAAEKSLLDELMLKRAQVDNHMANLTNSARYLKDVANVVRFFADLAETDTAAG